MKKKSDIEPGSLMLQDSKSAAMPEIHGDTLTWIPFAALPRFVAPEKPDPGLFGNKVGRVTGMISPNDYVTSIGFAQPFELFLALGWVGLAIGMGALGAIY